MFICDDVSCDELDNAINRASRAGLSFVKIQAHNQDFDALKAEVETYFGVNIGVGFYLKGQGDPGLTCPPARIHNEAKANIVGLATALVHIAAKFNEMFFGDGLQLTKDHLGSNLQVVLTADDIQNGITEAGEPTYMPSYQGFADRYAKSPYQVYLGSQIGMYAIVHELGHVFDYRNMELSSLPLRDLWLTGRNFREYPRGIPYYTTIPAPLDFPSDLYGALGEIGGNKAVETYGFNVRANPSGDQIETWADMFMTWVLDNQEVKAEGGIVGWADGIRNSDVDYAHAAFLNAYTTESIRRLMLAPSTMPTAFGDYFKYAWEVYGIGLPNWQ